MDTRSIIVAGLATVETVGFGGQTAPTTKFESPNCTNYHILKTNCSTISALIVEQFYVPPVEKKIRKAECQDANRKKTSSQKTLTLNTKKSRIIIIIMKILGFNKTVPLPVEPVGFECKLHQLPTGQPQTTPSTTRNQRFH